MLHLLSYHAENFSRVIHLAVSPGLSVFKKRLHSQQILVQRYTASRAHVIEPEVELLLCLICHASFLFRKYR